LQWIEQRVMTGVQFEKGCAVEVIDLAYVGRGIHEELVAHIADQEGYFEEERVHVALRDGIGWPAERLRRGAVIGLGRALQSRLTDRIDWTAVSVSTDRPLFWFLGGADVKSMADLRGRRLAVHGPSEPPGIFARIVMRQNGLDPDRDVQCVVRQPGDYQMDLRRLRDGSIDAAYVGSTMAPEQVVAEEGFHVLAWVGDHFQIPTVGIVVDPTHIPLDSPALLSVVRANQRALRLLAEQPGRGVDYLAWFLDRLTREEAQRHYDHYVGPYFIADRKVDPEITQQSIDAVATELGVATTRAGAFYAPLLTNT
jgi:ABC-type nitrate/sulfonate/bicarbonate transport system substrate-binding protein